MLNSTCILLYVTVIQKSLPLYIIPSLSVPLSLPPLDVLSLSSTLRGGPMVSPSRESCPL